MKNVWKFPTKKSKICTFMKKKLVVYAFIDSQNLNLGTSKDIVKGRKTIYRRWRFLLSA